MRNAMRALFRAFANLGMANDLSALYQTTPPVPPPSIPTGAEALELDARAIHSDWLAVGATMSSAFSGTGCP